MIKLGITGGIGSGKSIVANILAQMLIPIYEADKAAKNIVENNFEIKTQIIDLLGVESYDQNNCYNKAYVAKKVFDNNELLSKLNAIVHPAVASDFENWLKQNKSSKIVAKEAAIMSKNAGLDKILFVSAPIDLRIERVLARDSQRSREQIMSIIEKQKSEEEYTKIADFIIVNDDKTLLMPQILEVIKQLL
jgi:dephospho-CoA kinase